MPTASPSDRQHQLDSARAIINAIVDAVREGGPAGVPGGTLYAALMRYMDLRRFELIMDLLVRSGQLKKRGHHYFIP